MGEKINALPASSDITGDEILPIDQDPAGGTDYETVRATLQKLVWQATKGITAGDSPYTLADGYGRVSCDATSGAITLTIASDQIARDGKPILVVKTDASANAVTIGTEGAETINGAATYVLSEQWQAVLLVPNGTNVFAWVFFMDAERTKLAGIEAEATADQTGAEIKAAYEAEADTNAYTDAEKTKVGHLTVTAATDLDTIRTRVDALDAAVVLIGSWDASAGTFPGAGAAQAGWSYIVTVAGTVDGVAFSVNDRLVAIVDDASTSTYAANWLHLDYSDIVASVAGLTGAIAAGDLRTAIDFANQARAAIGNIIGSDGKADADLDMDGHAITGATSVSVSGEDTDLRYSPQVNLLSNAEFLVNSQSTLANYGAAIADDDCADDDTGDWTKTANAGLVFDTDHYEMDTDGGAGTCYIESRSFTEKHLYLHTCKFKDGTQAGATVAFYQYDGVASNYSPLITTTAAWVEHTWLHEPAETTAVGHCGVYDADNLGGNNFEMKDYSVYEVVPSYTAADTKAPDGWEKDFSSNINLYVVKDIVKSGAIASLKVVSLSDYYDVKHLNSTFETSQAWVSRFAGRTVTMGCWVKSSVTAKGGLLIYDGTTVSTSYTEGTDWEWVTLTYTFPTDSTLVSFRLRAGTATVYFSQPMLVFGSVCERFVPRPGEVVWPVVPIAYEELDSQSGLSSLSEELKNLREQTSGRLPAAAKAVLFTASMRDSASLTTDTIGLFLRADTSKTSSPQTFGRMITDDKYYYASPVWVALDDNGDIRLSRYASGAGTLDIDSAKILAVELR